MRARTKVMLFAATLILGVALAAVVLISVNLEPEGRYRVTIVNVGTTTILGGALDVQQQKHVLPRLRPRGAVVFEGRVDSDDDYKIDVTRESGVTIADSLGYLTNGVASDDTILVTDTVASLPHSHSRTPGRRERGRAWPWGRD